MEQNTLKVKVQAQRRQELEEEASRLCERLPVQMQRVMDCIRERRGHRTGSLHCPWRNWVSVCTRLLSVMLSVYVMAGSLHTCHPTVYVVSSKQLSMLSAAHMEGFQH